MPRLLLSVLYIPSNPNDRQFDLNILILPLCITTDIGDNDATIYTNNCVLNNTVLNEFQRRLILL